MTKVTVMVISMVFESMVNMCALWVQVLQFLVNLILQVKNWNSNIFTWDAVKKIMDSWLIRTHTGFLPHNESINDEIASLDWLE